MPDRDDILYCKYDQQLKILHLCNWERHQFLFILLVSADFLFFLLAFNDLIDFNFFICWSYYTLVLYSIYFDWRWLFSYEICFFCFNMIVQIMIMIISLKWSFPKTICINILLNFNYTSSARIVLNGLQRNSWDHFALPSKLINIFWLCNWHFLKCTRYNFVAGLCFVWIWQCK